MSDIIAENQTEAVLSVLDRGEADDKTRDRVSAALLRSQTRLLADLAEVKAHLWKPKDLEELVDRRHAELCAACPAKAAATRAPPRQERPLKKTLAEALLTSDSLRYFVLILILVWAVVYLKAGPEGVAAVKGAATTVVHR